MKKMKFAEVRIPVLWIGLVLSCVAFLGAESQYKVLGGPDRDIYFGHVSYIEDINEGKTPLVFREGRTDPETAVVNLPITAGDLIWTMGGRRLEIQFDTGTVLRLDRHSELKVETLLAQSLSSRKKLTNLVLLRGRAYVMHKRYDSREVFQFITPNAAVKIDHKSVAVIGSGRDLGTDVQVLRGKARVLYGPDADHTKSLNLKSGQRLFVTPDHEARQIAAEQKTEFFAWNEAVNRNFEELHEGITDLPKPIRKMPEAIFRFAQNYGRMYGEWVWNERLGYVWRPYFNDSYPSGTWQPYAFGRWREINGQMFWVPAEAWGWVPYHLGIWHWDKNLGWLWIPGSAFAPAWVDWNFFFGSFAWRPLMLWDWLYYGGYADFFPPGMFQFASLEYYYTGPEVPEDPANLPPNTPSSPMLTKIRKDQLHRNVPPPYDLPKEMKRAYENLGRALKEGDQALIAAIRRAPDSVFVVKGSDLNAEKIQNKALSLQQFRTGPGLNPTLSIPYKTVERIASSSYRRNAAIREIVRSLTPEQEDMRDRIFSGGRSIQESGVRSAQSPSPVREETGSGGIRSVIRDEDFLPMDVEPVRSSYGRFRDWNPDVKVARSQGVRISYSSRTNEIQCPSLGLTSRNVVTRFSATRRGFLEADGGRSLSDSGARSGDGESTVSTGSSTTGSETSGAAKSSGSSASTRTKVSKEDVKK